MRGGKATGKNREYQLFCRDILVKDESSLRPLAGDGIDVPIALGGTTYYFDVALTDGHRLVLAECKRWRHPIKQADLALFAYKANLFRKERSTEAAGSFFAASKYQLGAIMVGEWEGVRVAVCSANQRRDVFRLSYHSYDRARDKRLLRNIYHEAGEVALRLSVSAEVKFIPGVRGRAAIAARSLEGGLRK